MTTPSDASQAVELPSHANSVLDILMAFRKLDEPTEAIKRALHAYGLACHAAAIAQDRAARAQAEPVAWMNPNAGSVDRAFRWHVNGVEPDHGFTIPVYAAARAQAEPAAERCKECGGIDIPWGLGKCCCPKILKGRDDREHDGADAQGAAQGGGTDAGGSGEGARPGANVGDEHRSAAAETVGHADYSLGDSVRLPDARAIQEAIDLTPEPEARPVGGFAPSYAAPTIPQAAEVPGFVLVPREPTNEMMMCGTEWIRNHYAVRNCYRAMLAAVPTPTASAPKAEGEAVTDGIREAEERFYDVRRFYEQPSEADRTREGGDVVAWNCARETGLGKPRCDKACGMVFCGTTTSEGASPAQSADPYSY